MLMKANIERALAPSVARNLRYLLELPIPLGLKEWLWHNANRYFLHHSAKVIGRDKFGQALNCQVNDFVQKHIAVFGVWEPKLTHYLLSKPRSGIFIDVGANIGYYTLLASRIFDSVVAFEPSPISFIEMATNLAHNQINNARAFQVAISPERGTKPLYKSINSNSGMASVKRRSGAHLEAEVQCGPMSDYVSDEEWKNVSFIKIDVEGAEIDVVHSLLPKMPLLPSGVEIMIESSSNDTNGNLIFELLTKAGFSAFDLRSTYCLAEYFSPSTYSLEPIFRPPEEFTDCIFKRSTPPR